MTNIPSVKYQVMGKIIDFDISNPRENFVSIVSLGVFDDLDKAVEMMTVYRMLDSTYDDIDILEVENFPDVPDMDIYYYLSFNALSELEIRTKCVLPEGEPFLRVDDEYFEALALPSDKDAITKLALDWYSKNNNGKLPTIIEMIPDHAQDVLDELK